MDKFLVLPDLGGIFSFSHLVKSELLLDKPLLIY